MKLEVYERAFAEQKCYGTGLEAAPDWHDTERLASLDTSIAEAQDCT